MKMWKFKSVSEINLRHKSVAYIFSLILVLKKTSTEYISYIMSKKERIDFNGTRRKKINN